MAQLAIGLLTKGVSALFGGGAATAAPVVGGAATGGFSFASILQGGATLLGAMSAIQAGNAEADALNAQAIDAEAQKPFEMLQGMSRRSSIRREMLAALGDQDVAYAASGVDLSFGTPAQARREAFREGDNALTNDQATEESRLTRLTERSNNYRRAARRARSRGYVTALGDGINFLADVRGRG